MGSQDRTSRAARYPISTVAPTSARIFPAGFVSRSGVHAIVPTQSPASRNRRRDADEEPDERRVPQRGLHAEHEKEREAERGGRPADEDRKPRREERRPRRVDEPEDEQDDLAEREESGKEHELPEDGYRRDLDQAQPRPDLDDPARLDPTRTDVAP